MHSNGEMRNAFPYSFFPATLMRAKNKKKEEPETKMSAIECWVRLV